MAATAAAIRRRRYTLADTLLGVIATPFAHRRTMLPNLSGRGVYGDSGGNRGRLLIPCRTGRRLGAGPAAALDRHRGHGEHQHRQGPGADQGGRVLPEHGAVAQPDLGEGDQQGQGGGGQQHQLHPPDRRQVPAVQEQGRHPPDGQQQHEEGGQPQRGLGDRADVQGHARGHEEQRDEEAIADGVELALEGVGVAGGPAAQHDPGQERAQDHIQAELLGHGQQEQEQQHGQADGGLGGRALALAQDPPQLVAPDQPGRVGQDQGQHAHRGQRPQGHELAAGPQEQGDGEDREQLPTAPAASR
jgi:hypothetical protein